MPALRRLLILAATAFVLCLLVLDVLSIVGWPDDGPIALAQVLAAHLTIAAVLIIPVAFLHEAVTLRVALVALLVLSLVRFGGEWWSLPAGVPQDEASLEVMTLNLEVGSQAAADSVAFLRTATARVVALQELTPAVAAAITADPALAGRYPYQALFPSSDVLGLGLLSADPLTGVRYETGPSRLLARAESPVGAVRLVNVHPLHGEIARGPGGIPLAYETSAREAALDAIRDSITADPDPSPVLLLGDINTAPTEPAFGRFIQGYRDAHAEVGFGPGWSYRPDAFEGLGIGLIRIDVILTGAGLRPVAEATVCPPTGDHCAVSATVVAEK
jgi:endonuclease/exonuclease/phosphatase (EEP) superfamily protein YafD